jgi:hypothetical protein
MMPAVLLLSLSFQSLLSSLTSIEIFDELRNRSPKKGRKKIREKHPSCAEIIANLS